MIGHALMAICMAGTQAARDRDAAERERMVAEQIERRGISNAEVLRAMRATPRHRFVPERLHVLAYQDHPLPLGWGATISQPYVVALMTSLLGVNREDRVLEIGTGSGYQAAILSQLARQVYTVEIVPDLAKSAGRVLSELGYKNVAVRQGDGYVGLPGEAPFDRIILTAAPPEVPEALLRQLANGGRLVAPVGATWDQELVVIEKGAGGKLTRRIAGTVTFVPMRSPKN